MDANTQETRSMGVVAAIAAIAVALVLSAGALIVAAAGGGGSAPIPLATAAGAVAGGDLATEVDVELDEMVVLPATIEVAEGGTLQVTNAGVAPHDLVVEGTDLATPMLSSGESAAMSLDGLAPGTYTVFCSVAGHRAAGMEATLVVGGGGDDAGVGADEDATDATGADDDATTASFDPNAAPPDGFEARDPRLAPAPDTDVHELTIRASQVEGEVAPGVTQELWTFDDQVPGPILRGKVGDIFTVTLVNEGVIGHSIDFHSSKVAWNDEMRTIGPGESLVYQFEAKHAGAYMYHCGTPPTLHHIGNGMHGAMIIDPPDLPPVDHEFVFVQHEYYTGPEGGPGDLTKMVDDEWDAVVFNGYVNQYLHAPIRVEPNERIRAWVVNNGPSENSSFHIVGTIFDTVFKEGTVLLAPDGRQGGAQALDLQPAQGGYVEFTFDVEGLYPIVTHKFSNVGKGALGLFQAGDVESDGAGH
jgi:nitrite reductase (NO-forming)